MSLGDQFSDSKGASDCSGGAAADDQRSGRAVHPRRVAQGREVSTTGLVPLDRVGRAIFILRGRKVILDSDLAALYGVPVKRLNEQVKRNADRFPPDFAFVLTKEEGAALRSQIATLEKGPGEHRKYLPRVFTEHGALMAASVLNSPRAVEMSILVVRAFVRFRQILATNRQLAAKLDELDNKIASHDKSIADHGKSIAAHRKGIVSLYAAIENLMPTLTDRQIGFKG
ncbi:MAG: ORF6N domain-containing protein, partial [Polyangia bacterium]